MKRPEIHNESGWGLFVVIPTVILNINTTLTYFSIGFGWLFFAVEIRWAKY